MLRIGAVTILFGLFLTSCKQLECAEGTVEENGKCVAIGWSADAGPEAYCGPNTVWDGEHCVPAQDICGPYTKVKVVVDDAGVETFVCEGTPSGNVQPPPECPAPEGDTICINGWVRYLVDPEHPDKVFETIAADADAADDATSMVVMVYDPLRFASNPDDPAALLGTCEVNPKTGTFRATNIPVPTTGFLALATEDCQVQDGVCQPIPATTDPATYAFTAFPYPASAGTNLVEVQALAVQNDQMEAWTQTIGDSALQAAGCDPNATLSSCGTWIGLFARRTEDGLEPLEGVVPYAGTAPIDPAKSFYFGVKDGAVVFDDPSPGAVWSDDSGPHEWTGIHGLVFAANMTLTTYYGQCAPDLADSLCNQGGCTWDNSRLGGTAKGALFVQLIDPEACPNL